MSVVSKYIIIMYTQTWYFGPQNICPKYGSVLIRGVENLWLLTAQLKVWEVF